MRRPSPRLFLATLAISLICGAAFGGDNKPSKPVTAEQQVKAAVVDKLLEQHRRRSMFSRAVITPPRYETSVAKTQAVDGDGATFVTFEVGRHTWAGIAPMPSKRPPRKRLKREAANRKPMKRPAAQQASAPKMPEDKIVPVFTGCVYPATGDVYVVDAGDKDAALTAADTHPALQVGAFDLAPDEKAKTASSFSKRSSPCQAEVPVG